MHAGASVDGGPWVDGPTGTWERDGWGLGAAWEWTCINSGRSGPHLGGNRRRDAGPGRPVAAGDIVAGMSIVAVPAAVNTIDGLPAAVFLLIELAAIAFYFLCLVMILRRAGYSGWWVLVNLIPIVGNVAFLAYLAFVPWPGTGAGSSGTFVPRERYSHRASQSAADFSTFGPGGPLPGASYGSPSATGLFSQAAAAPLPKLTAPSAPVVVTSGGQVTPVHRPAPVRPVVTHPVGWYPSEEHPGYERYWDGSAWTDQFRAAQGTIH